MTEVTRGISITAAEIYKGDVIIHFSNSTSIFYHAHFLDKVRNDDGNVALPEDPDDASEALERGVQK